MADLVICNKQDLVAVADAVRSKTGESAGMRLGEVPNKINSISGSMGGSELYESIIARTVKSVSSDNLDTIGEYAFSGCTSLTSVNFPLVTTIPKYAFDYCQNLSSVVFGDVTSVGYYAFDDCTSLTHFDYPLVTTLDTGAFSGCTKLTTVNLPLLLTIKSHSFSDCSSLLTADFPLVTSVESWGFTRCKALNSINMPQLKIIGYNAFQDCENLTTVNFPCVTSVGDEAFYDCSRLTTADFSVVAAFESSAFHWCSNLKELILRTNTVVGVQNGDILKGTKIDSGIGYIYVPENLVDSYKSDFYWQKYSNQIKPIGWVEGDDEIEITFYLVCDDLGIQETHVSNSITWASYIENSQNNHLTYDSQEGGNVYYDGYMIYERDTNKYPDFNDGIVDGATYIIESDGPV